MPTAAIYYCRDQGVQLDKCNAEKWFPFLTYGGFTLLQVLLNLILMNECRLITADK